MLPLSRDAKDWDYNSKNHSGLWKVEKEDDPVCVRSRTGCALMLDGCPLLKSTLHFLGVPVCKKSSMFGDTKSVTDSLVAPYPFSLPDFGRVNYPYLCNYLVIFFVTLIG